MFVYVFERLSLIPSFGFSFFPPIFIPVLALWYGVRIDISSHRSSVVKTTARKSSMAFSVFPLRRLVKLLSYLVTPCHTLLHLLGSSYYTCTCSPSLSSLFLASYREKKRVIGVAVAGGGGVYWASLGLFFFFVFFFVLGYRALGKVDMCLYFYLGMLVWSGGWGWGSFRQ